MTELNFTPEDHPVVSANPSIVCEQMHTKSREDLIEENTIYALILQSYRIELRQQIETVQCLAESGQSELLERAVETLTRHIEEGPI